MPFKKRINRKISWLGYLLIGIASNGIFSIYLPSKNPGTPLITWLILVFIAGAILLLKTLRFPTSERTKIILADVLYVLIFAFFGLFQLPIGINFIIASVLATFFLYSYIDRKYLVELP